MHADVASILRVGREARIHLVIATQNSGSRRMIVDADTGQARSFQSYWQYSPGTTELADAPDSAIREAWAATAQVLGTRGRTAPRVAPQVDGQEFRDLDVEELRGLAVESYRHYASKKMVAALDAGMAVQPSMQQPATKPAKKLVAKGKMKPAAKSRATLSGNARSKPARGGGNEGRRR